jgi:hypothetical protein
MANCKATTKSGAPCRAQAGVNGLCYLHARPERARLLGQVGGRKNRQQLPEPPTGPFSATDLRNTLADAIRGVQAKTLTPRAASAIAQLCNSAKSLLMSAELEDRVARLEQQLAEQQRAASDPHEAETKGRAAAGEEATEQPVEEESSTLPDAGQPIEGGDDGVEDNGEGIAEEED